MGRWGNTSDVVFVEERSLRGLTVYVANLWRKYHLSHVAGTQTVQSGGHLRHHVTRLRKGNVGSYFVASHIP